MTSKAFSRLIGWGAVILVVLLIGLPTAVLFGLADVLTDGLTKGLITVLGTLLFVALLLAISYAWDQMKERRRGRYHQPPQ